MRTRGLSSGARCAATDHPKVRSKSSRERPIIIAYLSQNVKLLRMRDAALDEQFIREVLRKNGVIDVIYVTPNTYDGGYEVRAGTLDFFVEYGTIDDRDETTIVQHYEKR